MISLQNSLTALNLTLSENQQQQLLDYLAILIKWNKAYNLVGAHDEQTLLTHHLLDSLSVTPFIKQSPVLDVGTGAGLPGIPLAIALPEIQFTLIDSNGKKTRFLKQVTSQLSLKNVQAVQDRVENLQTNHGFNVIISRAVGSVALLMSCSQHLLKPGGEMMLMKGAIPQQELAAIDNEQRIEELKVPGVEGQRHLIIIRGAQA
ncbi:MAG: 16S rRNA (guanine(527)-N(7))-methyltransferase RsmG [Gammaproteobacteria bacterium]|nr:16S rRNA (guanine(527)-N(7))-methyltransferase RsmG [Gammaproteobacteria bacterium]MCH9744292.1 16S rRNA (guanine(527)-N(7))-methyltransferase RsmG [Gammaproteobacteria bacterium]